MMVGKNLLSARYRILPTIAGYGLWGYDVTVAARITSQRSNAMKRITTFTLATTVLLCLAGAPFAGDAFAQQKQQLVLTVGAANTKYSQQHAIDVDDVPGHQMRVFEVRRIYPTNPPVINGMKIVESWARGASDYTNNNGPAVVYHTYVAENGDKLFAQSATVVVQGSEEGNFIGTTVGPITGGTGKLAGIRGLMRLSLAANPVTGENETQAEIEYWFAN
jgi:hypothetical protein